MSYIIDYIVEQNVELFVCRISPDTLCASPSTSLSGLGLRLHCLGQHFALDLAAGLCEFLLGGHPAELRPMCLIVSQIVYNVSILQGL